RVVAPATSVAAPALAAIWARSHLRDLEDRYAVDGGDRLESRIVDTSLSFGVLCRFTAYVAIDPRVVNAGGDVHRVIQPVEMPSGWEMSSGGMNRAYTLASAAMPAPGTAMPMSLNATGGRVAKVRRSLSEPAEPGSADRARAVPDLTFGARPQP